jgi:hypothetical protein
MRGIAGELPDRRPGADLIGGTAALLLDVP